MSKRLDPTQQCINMLEGKVFITDPSARAMSLLELMDNMPDTSTVDGFEILPLEVELRTKA